MDLPSPRKKAAGALLLSASARKPAKKRLSELEGATKQWIMTDPLDDVFLSLLVLYVYAPSFFDGETLALIARRLIASEMEPGGPYGDGTARDLEANAAIAQLFLLMGAPLPKTTDYVLANAAKNNVVSDIFTRLLTFPASLVKTNTKPKPILRKDPAARATTKDIRGLGGLLQESADEVWKELQGVHSYREIISISADFAASLRIQSVPVKSLPLLGRANIYFWMAYTIYDDFIDDEGVPVRLSVANWAQRFSLALYGRVFPKSSRLAACFDQVDTANMWELKYCRFTVTAGEITVGPLPDYKDGTILAERSIGHVMGPLELLLFSGVSPAKRAVVSRGLEHFLIARQLSDDLHDWQEDVSRGHISYVVTHILQALKVRPGRHALNALLGRMEAYFFEQGFSTLSEQVLGHVAAARSSFTKSGLFVKNAPFLGYLTDIEKTIVAAKEEHAKSREFIAAYKNK